MEDGSVQGLDSARFLIQSTTDNQGQTVVSSVCGSIPKVPGGRRDGGPGSLTLSGVNLSLVT